MEKKYFDQSNRLNEGKKVTLKRRYTENYPAITAGKAARIRNKMLEAIADGKITQEEFDTMLSELSANSKKWMTRNTKYFNVSEDGISLSKFGRRVLNQIKINENTEMENFMFESFNEFVNTSLNENDSIEETLFEATVIMDAMAPDDRNFLKFLKKNNVEIIDTTKSGPSGQPEITMQGKRKDLEKVLADCNFGWCDEDLAEYIEESVINEGYVRTRGYKETEDRIERLMTSLRPDSMLCKSISKKADNVTAEFREMGKHMDEIMSIWQEVEYTIAMSNESVEVNEAFKSSKLRNLMSMDQSAAYGKEKNLAKGLYGLSKIKLDQIEDSDLVDLAPKFAYKDLRKNRDYVVFYIVDNEKENPYADSTSMTSMLKPGILAVSRGSDFLGVHYDQRDSRASSDKRGGKLAFGMNKQDDGAVGGNKKYRGYSASGIYTVKRASELADRAIAIDITAMGKSAQDLIKQRAEAQEGAIAFKNDKDFKKANMQRYKDILATKASKMPLDKMVEGAINTLTKHIADAMKRGEKTKYNEIKIGEDKKGRDIKLTDAANIMSSILGDYERYVRYVADDEREKGTEYYSGYYEKEMKEYAKRVSDRVKKVKDMDYAW